MKTEGLPVLAVCGWSGSGKTTLLEAAVARLTGNGLRVAVVKSDAHGIDVDTPGKDSDRLFRAGANVRLLASDEDLSRSHTPPSLQTALTSLALANDLVLVEGHKALPLPKVWLAGADGSGPPEGCDGVLAVLPWDSDRTETFSALLDDWLRRTWLETPVNGCVATDGGADPLHGRTADLMRLFVRRVVAVGEADSEPAGAADHLPPAPDLDPGTAAPLTAMRWGPGAAWIVARDGCPHTSMDLICDVLNMRAPGVWAILPRPSEQSPPDPLRAYFDPRARALLEAAAGEGEGGAARLTDSPQVIAPVMASPASGA